MTSASDWWFDIAKFPEQRGGLLVAGIEYGTSGVEPDSDIESWENARGADPFYSNPSTRFRYRTRAIRWFEILGAEFCHGLRPPTPLERRIQSTNWLMRARKNSNLTTVQDLAGGSGLFAAAVRSFDPSVLVLMGIRLFDLVIGEGPKSERTRAAFSSHFGPFEAKPNREDYFVFSQPPAPRKTKRFRFGIARFEKLIVMGFPHPTGSRGLSDKHLQEPGVHQALVSALGLPTIKDGGPDGR